MKDKLEAVPNTKSVEREEDKHISRVKPPQRIGWWLIGLLVLFGAAVLTNVALHYRTVAAVPPWVTFLTDSLLNLFLLSVVIAQAYIYDRQRLHMEEQSKAMREQLDGMNEQQKVLLQQLTWSGLQTYTMLNQWTSMRASENALKRQADAFERQLEAMVAQLSAMQDGLAETRKIVAHNERAIAPYFGTSKIVFRYVANRPDGAGGVLESNQPEVIITFMNGGNTPAWHFLVVPHLVLGNSPYDDKCIGLNVIHDRECPDSETTFYPSGAERCMKFQGRDEFSAADVEAISAQTMRLFLVINLGYSDMKNDRTTHTFIRELNPSTRRFGDWGSRQQ